MKAPTEPGYYWYRRRPTRQNQSPPWRMIEVTRDGVYLQARWIGCGRPSMVATMQGEFSNRIPPPDPLMTTSTQITTEVTRELSAEELQAALRQLGLVPPDWAHFTVRVRSDGANAAFTLSRTDYSQA